VPASLEPRKKTHRTVHHQRRKYSSDKPVFQEEGQNCWRRAEQGTPPDNAQEQKSPPTQNQLCRAVWRTNALSLFFSDF
jgi:hypothetical protein